MARQQKNDRVMQQRPAIVRRGRRTVRQINKAIENLEKLKENVEDSEIINKIDEQIKKIEEISKSISENLKFIEDNVSENVEIDDNMSKGEANRIGNLRNEIVRNTRALQSAENSFGNIIQNINSEEQLADLVNGNILDDISEISRKQENISQDQEDVVKQEETRTTDANQPETGDIDGRIATAQERLRATGERMRAARTEGNDQAYAQARSEYSSLTEEISNLQNEKQRQEEARTADTNQPETGDIDGRIATAQERLRATGERMRAARAEGNDQAYAQARSEYSSLTEEISNLQNEKQRQEKARTADTNQPETGDIDGRIATAQERLRATGERMRAARAEGNDQAYAQARSEYSSLTEEISNLQNEKQRQEETKTPKANEQEAEDIDGRIATAQKELRETAEKVRAARKAGNEEEAKEEQKKYNEIASKIKKLVIKKQNEAIKKNRAKFNEQKEKQEETVDKDNEEDRNSELDSKKNELDTLIKSILSNGGNITPEQVNKIKQLKKKIKLLEDKQNGQLKIEDKHDGQLKIEDKHDGQQLRIEDKRDGQLKLEDKKNGQLKIEDQRKPVGYIEMKDEHPVVNPEMALGKTGLQIFREQFNQMPEMKKKHAISESPAKWLLASAGVISAAVVTGPVGVALAIGGVAATAAYKPIMKVLTGQRKLEKQIQEQFMKMDTDEFLKMAKYLNEEKIITLKPHAVILNALEKAAKTKCSQEASRLREEKSHLVELQEKLGSKSNKTPEELRELAEAGKRLKEIDGHGDELGELEELYRIPKEIKRGTQRKSAEYKGNMAGKKIMNLFAKRNNTTKEYSGFINNYADAERAGDEEQYFADIERQNGNEEEALKREDQARKFHNLQKSILKNNTKVVFGISRGPGNAGEDGTTARIVSDQKDQTIRVATAAATLGIGLTHTLITMVNEVNAVNLNADEAERVAQMYNGREDEYAKIIEAAKQNGNVSPEEIKKAIMSELGTQANAGEQANLSQFGTASYQNAGYVEADGLLNETVRKEFESLNKEDLSKLSSSELIERLQKAIIKSGESQQLAGQQLDGKEFMSGVDHVANAEVNLESVEGKNYEAELLGKFGNLLKKLENFKPGEQISANVQRLKNNFFGPAMSTIAAVIYRAKDIKDNHKESKDKKEQDRDNGMEI